MKKLLAKLILIHCFCFALTHSNAQENFYTLSKDSLVNFYAGQKRVYYATRTENRPKIDGRLTDGCWAEGVWSGGFRQQQPNQAQEPSQNTEIKILYDNQNLYVGIRCYDKEPKKIRPILGRRDDYSAGDVAGIAFDTYFDKRTAFEFDVTAAGQKTDLMHLGAYEWDTNWDAVWDGKAAIGDSVWTVEMRIPFSQLRFADKDEHVWGMHVWRWIDRFDEEDHWKLIPIDAPAMVYIFGELRGIKDIQSKRKIELLPYMKAKYITDAHNNEKFGFGLDGKIGVTSDYTLDLTVNPDFGQVEADPSELNLTSYEVFYDEKRPFFLEGNSILDYSAGDDMLFYSRRIGHAPSFTPEIQDGESAYIPENTSILNALKLTGKNKKGFSLGVINSMTAKENALIYGEGGKSKVEIEPFTNFFIGRAKQDFNQGNTVLGGVATSTTRSTKSDDLAFLPGQSSVGGVDFQHNWKNRKYYFEAKSFFSHVTGSDEAISSLEKSSRHYYQRLDARHLEFDSTCQSMSGWGGELAGGKRSGKFRAEGTFSWRSPGVELNDAGYLKQADWVNQKISLRYQVNKPHGILRNYYSYLTHGYDWSYGGEKLGGKINFHVYTKFTNLWSVHWDFIKTYQTIDTRQLRGGPSLYVDSRNGAEIFIQTNPDKKFFFGGGIDCDWYDDNISKSAESTFYIAWQISNRFTLSSRTVYDHTINNSQYVTQKTIDGLPDYFVGKIDRHTLYTIGRIELFLTPELSLQYYGSPYASIGKYIDIKRVNTENPHAKNISERFSKLTILENDGDKIYLDSNNDQLSDFAITNPDFNFQELRSNFVARWEFRPGSTLYFVWTHNRTSDSAPYCSDVLNSFGGIFNVKPQNVFLIKFSYWFPL